MNDPSQRPERLRFLETFWGKRDFDALSNVDGETKAYRLKDGELIEIKDGESNVPAT